MAYYKLVVDDETIYDLSSDTATKSRVLSGKNIYNKTGKIINGTLESVSNANGLTEGVTYETESSSTSHTLSISKVITDTFGGYSTKVAFTDDNLTASNIATGEQVLDKIGTYLGGYGFQYFTHGKLTLSSTVDGSMDGVSVAIPYPDEWISAGATAKLCIIMTSNNGTAISGYTQHLGGCFRLAFNSVDITCWTSVASSKGKFYGECDISGKTGSGAGFQMSFDSSQVTLTLYRNAGATMTMTTGRGYRYVIMG